MKSAGFAHSGRSVLSLLLATVVAAAVRPVPAAAVPPTFDGEKARRLVEAQCAFGPRTPGSSGHQKCLEFLDRELRATGAAVVRQPFTYAVKGGKPLEMCNLVATFVPDNPRRILLAAHWDTRPWADQDPDSTRRDQPILGANDGGSGVAVLLEVARILGVEHPAYGVDLVLFDGEDLGRETDEVSFFRGSREYSRRLAGEKPVFAVLLDMVGDDNQVFYQEGYSVRMAPQTVDWLWTGGRQVAPDRFIGEVGYFIEDDHLPLLAAGIPCADLIDFDYPYWHTLADTPDKVSAASLQVVGDVLLRLLYP